MKILTITINPGLSIIGIPPSAEPEIAYNFQFGGYGGSSPYTFELVDTVFPGTFDVDSTGLMTGQYAGAGDFPFTLELTDAVGRSVRQTYTLQIVPLPLALAGSLPYATAGAAYSQTLTVSGGVSPYVSAIKIAGPAWASVSLSGDIVTVSGTAPTYSSGTLTIKVTDSNANSVEVDYLLAVKLELQGTFPDAHSGEAYSEDIQILGGDGVYSNLRITVGSVPAGMALSIVQVGSDWKLRLSGTFAAGSFTVAVDSGDGQTATSAQSIAVAVDPNWDGHESVKFGAGSEVLALSRQTVLERSTYEEQDDNDSVKFGAGSKVIQLKRETP